MKKTVSDSWTIRDCTILCSEDTCGLCVCSLMMYLLSDVLWSSSWKQIKDTSSRCSGRGIISKGWMASTVLPRQPLWGTRTITLQSTWWGRRRSCGREGAFHCPSFHDLSVCVCVFSQVYIILVKLLSSHFFPPVASSRQNIHRNI